MLVDTATIVVIVLVMVMIKKMKLLLTLLLLLLLSPVGGHEQVGRVYKAFVYRCSCSDGRRRC